MVLPGRLTVATISGFLFPPREMARPHQLSSLNERKALSFRERENRVRETGKHRVARERVASLLPSVTGAARSNGPLPPAVVGLVVWLRGAQCCKTAGNPLTK